MATCPKCKTFYLNDECPTCKRERLAAPKAPEQPARPVRADQRPGQAPSEAANPAPKKKPNREASSMGGWSFLCWFGGVLMLLGSVPGFLFGGPAAFFGALFGSLPLFCAGKLFKCITEILANQVEILNLLDADK